MGSRCLNLLVRVVVLGSVVGAGDEVGAGAGAGAGCGGGRRGGRESFHILRRRARGRVGKSWKCVGGIDGSRMRVNDEDCKGGSSWWRRSARCCFLEGLLATIARSNRES